MGGRAEFGKIHGRITHGESDGQDPVSIGGHANDVPPTLVDEDDCVRGWWSRRGELHVIVVPAFAPNATLHAMKSVELLSTADTTILQAPGSSKSYRLSGVFASNRDPSLSHTFNLRDGTATIAVGRTRLDGGGWVWNWEPHGLWLTTNTAFKGNIDVTVSAGLVINVLFDVVDTPTA